MAVFTRVSGSAAAQLITNSKLTRVSLLQKLFPGQVPLSSQKYFKLNEGPHVSDVVPSHYSRTGSV